jgi:hypothetical protein
VIAGSILYSIYLVEPFLKRNKSSTHDLHEKIGKKQWIDAMILGALLMVGGQGF